MSAALTDDPHATDPAAGIGHVVLARTPRGDAEVQRALFPLSAAQRDLLGSLDGRRSLRQLVLSRPTLQSARLARDAARLLAFGLVKQLRGELPREVVVSSMNLTMRLPADAFRHLQPSEAAAARPTGPKPAPATAAASAASGRRSRVNLPWFALALAAVAALLVALWLAR